MIAWLLAVIAGAAFLVLAADVPRVALVAGFVALGVAWLIVFTWHRRKLAELRELHVDAGQGQFTPIRHGLRWPKRCTYCHHRVESWREAGVHQDPARSPCAAQRARLEAAELAAELAEADQPKWTAEVIPGPAAGLDTMTDELEGSETER